jgi:PAS domain S-box-containing protein
LATTSYYIEKEGITNLRVAGETGYFTRLAFASRSDWPELNSILEKGLAQISQAEAKSILEKWIYLEQDSFFDKKEFWISLFVGFGLIVVIIVGVVVWNRSLKKQVEQRTKDLKKELAERRKLEGELRKSRDELEIRVKERTIEINKLSRAVEQSPSVAVITDTKGNIEYVNPKFTQLTGYTLEEAIRQNPRILQSGNTTDKEYKRLWETITSGGEWRGEFRNKKKNGELYWESASISPVRNTEGAITHFVAVKENITERKQAEKAVRESEKKYRTLFESSPDGILITEIETKKYKYANPAMCRLLGYSENEIKDMKIDDIHPSDKLEFVISKFEAHAKGEIASVENIPFLRKDGTTVYMNVTGTTAIIDESNCSIGFFRDVTMRRRMEEELKILNESLEQRVSERTAELARTNEELRIEIDGRKLTEDALRKSESKSRSLSREFRTLLDAIDDPIIQVSSEMKILWANRRAAGLSKKEIFNMQGHDCYKLWFNRHTPCDDCPTVTCFQTGETGNTRFSTPDGRFWDLHSSPVKDENGRVNNVIEICKDITEEMVLQTESMRTGQLAELGMLAASVAHEINNPIFGIISCAQLLLEESKGGKEADHSIINMILKESDRIANVTRSLLSFVRAPDDVKSSCNIHEILSDTLLLIRAMMQKEGINVEVHIPQNLPEIIAYPQQIQHVFLNMIDNAQYALNEKYPDAHENKIIDITGKEVMINDRPHVQVIFYDRGNGIPDDKIDKVMNPFFTTKPPGKGTGLGLNICNKIIDDHGGKIEIDSIEGEYTKFIISLPVERSKI